MKPRARVPGRLLAVVVILPLLSSIGLLLSGVKGHTIDLNIQDRIETHTPLPDFGRPPPRATDATGPRSKNKSRKTRPERSRR